MLFEKESFTYKNSFEMEVLTNPYLREGISKSYKEELVDIVDSLEYSLESIKLQLETITTESVKSFYLKVLVVVEKKLTLLKKKINQIDNYSFNLNEEETIDIEDLVSYIKNKISILERFFFSENFELKAS